MGRSFRGKSGHGWPFWGWATRDASGIEQLHRSSDQGRSHNSPPIVPSKGGETKRERGLSCVHSPCPLSCAVRRGQQRGSERCPSGRRSTPGKCVSGSNRFKGSNPFLSASFQKFMVAPLAPPRR